MANHPVRLAMEGSNTERQQLLEDILAETHGTVSAVLDRIKDISPVSIKPIPEKGFPMGLRETARILGIYDDGESFVGTRKLLEDSKMTLTTYYIRKKNEGYVYELDTF